MVSQWIFPSLLHIDLPKWLNFILKTFNFHFNYWSSLKIISKCPYIPSTHKKIMEKFNSFQSVPNVLILPWLTPDTFTRPGKTSCTERVKGNVWPKNKKTRYWCFKQIMSLMSVPYSLIIFFCLFLSEYYSIFKLFLCQFWTVFPDQYFWSLKTQHCCPADKWKNGNEYWCCLISYYIK